MNALSINPVRFPSSSPRGGVVLLGLLAMALVSRAHAGEPQLLSDRQASDRPSLVVVGVAHFSNPDRDINNVKVDDVLAPERQREMEQIIERLAAYKPNHVAVEWPVEKQEKLDQRYRDYRAGRYQLSRDEVDQLGLRLAAKLNLPQVDAADWFREPPGKDSDYDFEAWARNNGAQAFLKAVESPGETDRDTDVLAHSTLSQFLCYLNAPERLAADNRRYFDFARIGNRDERPGANWVGSWYTRNLDIFTNLVRLAPAANDRVVAVFGAGHAFLLREFAQQSGAFSVSDPNSVLGCS